MTRNRFRFFFFAVSMWLLLFPAVFSFELKLEDGLTDANRKFLEMAKEYDDDIEYGDDGRIRKVTSFDGSYDLFEYGALSGKVERIMSYASDGKLVEATVFYRDSVTGQLLGYCKDSAFGFFSLLNKDNDVFLKGNSEKYDVYNTFFSSLVITTDNKALDFSYDDEGRLVVKRDDGKTTSYDQSGRIVSDGDAVYSYGDDGSLLSVEVVSNGSLLKRTEYEDSREKTCEFYDNGMLSKKVRFDESGNIEERYEGGKPYARIKYFDDNKRVREIEYL